MNKIYRMITLRGLLIGMVLPICSTVAVAQTQLGVGATFLLTPVNFNPNAQVGVAYGPVEINSTDPQGYNSTFIQNPPTAVQLNDDDASNVANIPAPPAGVQAGLPPGITLSFLPNGTISGALQLSGTPTQAGTFEFVVVYRDASWGCVCGQGQQGYAVLTITVSQPGNLTITGVPNPLSDGTYGSLYTPDVPAKFVGTGGIGTFSYAIGAGSLPPGMRLDGISGVLSGTPTSVGTFSFHMVATDNTGVGLYSVDSVFQLTIDSAQLTITAGNANMTYGGQVPILQSTAVSYDGFVNGDDASSSLSRGPTLTTDATSSSPVGKYNIYVGGAKANDYSISYQMGNLYVDSAQLTITAGDARMTYGGQVPTLPSAAVSYSGFVNGENASSGLSAGPTLGTDAASSSPVGKYTIFVGGAKANNYSISYQPGTLYVDSAQLTITAGDASMIYGGPLPSLGVSCSGFVNGDDASSSLSPGPTLTTDATLASSVGTYSINVGSAKANNYSISYRSGTLTVLPASLTITAGNASMTYGGPVPSLSVSYSGFVNGEDVSNLTSSASAGTTATSAWAAGAYPITVGGAVDPNYTFNYIPGTLTIVPAALEVTADAETKVYGTPDPDLHYTVSGLVNGDNNSIFTGALGRSPGENVGIYPITQGMLGAGGNYVVKFTGSDLNITKAPQQITWGQRLLFGCDNTTQFQLAATASSGLPVTYTTSSSAVATVAGDMLTLVQPGSVLITASQAGDSNYFAAANVADSGAEQIPSLVRQHWGDALFFDNSSDDYVQWQWYKNGNAIPGATNPYYSETPSLNGQYYVVATENTGATIQTCPLTITGGGPIPGGITVYPNPALGGASVTVTCAYIAASLQGARMQIIDMQGKVWQQITNVQPSMQVTMPTATGIYVIYLLLSNGQKATVNVLVND
jgi:hypothetical protein